MSATAACADLAPQGILRASINLGNPLLARRDATSGEVGGVSVDLARALAERLAVPLELVVFDTAGRSVEAVSEARADVGFFAIDPQRGQDIAFTAPYVLIEGCYLVRDASPLTRNEEVDRSGHRILVGQGSAYDLYLSRAITAAELVRAPNSQVVVDQFLAQHADVAAGVRQQLEADAGRHPGLRLLPGRFMVIRQAMGLPRVRGEAAASFLRDFVETMKTNGFVAEALARHQIAGVTLAPPAGAEPCATE